MTTNSVFSCDEQDSLDYNGYKLYRLVLDNPPEHFVKRFPDDFDPSTNRMVGGYVESADALNVMMNIMYIGSTNIRSLPARKFQKELLWKNHCLKT